MEITLTKYGPWKIWNGGECPVEDEARVQIQTANQTRLQAEKEPAELADNFNWYPDSSPHAVIAYREVTGPYKEVQILHDIWVRHWNNRAPMISGERVNDDFVKGTYTTYTTNGKPTKIIWKADK